MDNGVVGRELGWGGRVTDRRRVGAENLGRSFFFFVRLAMFFCIGLAGGFLRYRVWSIVLRCCLFLWSF